METILAIIAFVVFGLVPLYINNVVCDLTGEYSTLPMSIYYLLLVITIVIIVIKSRKREKVNKEELEKEIEEMITKGKGYLRISLNEKEVSSFKYETHKKIENCYSVNVYSREIKEMLAIYNTGYILFYLIIEPNGKEKGLLFWCFSIDINQINYYKHIEKHYSVDIFFNDSNNNYSLEKKIRYCTNYMYNSLKHIVPEKEDIEVLKQRDLKLAEAFDVIKHQISRFDEINNYYYAGADINYYKIELVKFKNDLDKFETELFRVESEANDLTNYRLEFIYDLTSDFVNAIYNYKQGLNNLLSEIDTSNLELASNNPISEEEWQSKYDAFASKVERFREIINSLNSDEDVENHKSELVSFKEELDDFESVLNRLEFELNGLPPELIKIRESIYGFRSEMLKFLAEPNTLESELVKIDSMTEDGWQFENYVAQLLLKNGFEHAEVTQGSNDYGVDVIAKKDDIIYAIQCKCYSNKLGNKPVQEVLAGKEFYKAHIGVVCTNNYFTNNAVELAKSSKVLLWDRDKLIELIKSTIDNHEE